MDKIKPKLEFRQIKPQEFSKAMRILDQGLKRRIRNNRFLLNKFKKFPQFFIGTFLDKEIVGIVCGFPREDYLLMSEIAIDSRFQKRGFGRMLIKHFEKVAKKNYSKINVGAKDNAINFYNSLSYSPFLLIQYKKGDYSINDFKDVTIIRNRKDKKFVLLDVEVNKADLNYLMKLRKRYPKAYFQYIFTKQLV